MKTFEHQWVAGSSDRTLLLLHGTGGNEHDLIPFGEFLDRSASLLSVRGRIDEKGANRFFRRFREGVFDQENMRTETEALMQFLQSSATNYGFDPAHVYAVGFSNGANMAASLMMRHPESLRGGFLMRAMIPFVPEPLPPLMGVSVLLASGERDPLVPRSDAEQLAALLVESGADVEHLWVPGGHSLTKPELEHARLWFAARN